MQHRDTNIEKNQIVIFEKFNVQGDRKKIFRALDCYEESPIYEEMIEIYESLLKEAKSLVRPKAVIYIEKNERQYDIKEFEECKEMVYSCLTIGEEIPKQISQRFDKGDYLEGMMLDAIGDCFTFEMFDQVYEKIYGYLKQMNYGAIRLSPGERGFAIEHHLLLEEKLKLTETIGVKLSEACMLQPVKSTTSVFIVDSQVKLTKKIHECKKCPDLSCKWRQEPYENKSS